MRRTVRAALLILVVVVLIGVRFSTTTIVVAEEAENASGAITLRLVDAVGSPQPDVAVSLFRFDKDWRYWEKLDRDIRSDHTGVARYDELPTDASYVVRARTKGELVGHRECLLLGEDARVDADLKVERPLATTIRVRNESGQPVAGAKIWSITHKGANGSNSFNWRTLQVCELPAEPSNDNGELVLPALPPGTIELRLFHADYAPCELKGIMVGSESVADVTLDRGVKLTLRIESDESDANESAVDAIAIDFRHRPYEHPSTLIGQLPELRPDGTAELTVAEGDYEWLRLQHPEYAVTPIYAERCGHTLADPTEPMEIRPGDNTFTFRLKRTVKVRGRVIDESSGKPVADQSVQGSLFAGKVAGPFSHFVDEWTHAAWGETNERGEYEVDLAAGRARVTFQGQGLIAAPEHCEIEVAADGSTTVPDILVRAMPKIRGVVLGEDGKPVPNAVVRFRGSLLTMAMQPVITDAEGRFELAPPWVPQDLQTHENQPRQTIVAFHPHEPVDAHTKIRLDKPDSLGKVVLRLEPQDTESLIAKYPADLSSWQRGIVPAEQKESLAAISLAGKPAPELDGVQWLNTKNQSRSLYDFRSQYVLLQFWATWCGPCHADMPSLKLLQKLYGDKGLVVIGVHDNSMPLDAIKADVEKEKLPYPIVVDHQDGRIFSSYEAHGLSGYPSYVLIGRDGRVLQDDDTIAGPSLRTFKIEIIRQLLMSARDDGRQASRQ